MEYYKELFFVKKKHSYDLHKINFHIETQESVVQYNNVPSKGFKLVGCNLLDPMTGYIFHSQNATQFKEQLISQNLLINGVCIKPIIFEYIKDGSFNAHIYDDVKNVLSVVMVCDKISLSESKIGDILRNIEDESYYIYLGLVGQYYVTTKGKSSVKKKHLVLKTDNINGVDDTTILTVHQFNYVPYTKHTEKKYVLIKSVNPTNLKIKCYMYHTNVISIGDYVNNDVFDIKSFQKKFPTLVLSNTVRTLFSSKEISMGTNKVVLTYDYIGETSISLKYDVKFVGSNSNFNIFYDVELKSDIIADDVNDLVDFENNNYAIELDGDKYLMTTKMLYEVGCYNPYFIKGNYFKNLNHSYLILLKLNTCSVMNNKQFYHNHNDIHNINWDKKVKIYKVCYLLNKHHSYNLFNHNTDYEKLNTLNVIDDVVFDIIDKQHSVTKTVIGYIKNDGIV